MNRLIAGISLLAVSLIIGITSLYIQINTCDKLCEKIEASVNTLENEEKTKENCEKLYSYWERKKVVFHIFTDHSEIMDLEYDMAKVPEIIDKKEELKDTLLQCENEINHIKTSSYPSLGNIF